MQRMNGRRERKRGAPVGQEVMVAWMTLVVAFGSITHIGSHLGRECKCKNEKAKQSLGSARMQSPARKRQLRRWGRRSVAGTGWGWGWQA